MPMKQRLLAKRNKAGTSMQIKYVAFIIFYSLITVSCGQTKTDTKREMNSNLKQEKDFTDEEVLQYHEFLQEWQISYFNDILKSTGFRQDCVDCSDIVWKVDLMLDEKGMIKEINILSRDIQCAKKSEAQIQELENKVIESFKNKKVPDIFKSTTLQVTIGRVSRC